MEVAMNAAGFGVASTGLGVVGTLLTGSVSTTVAARADCSVEIAYDTAEPKPSASEHRLAA